MHPAFSILFFTTLAGVAQGLLDQNVGAERGQRQSTRTQGTQREQAGQARRVLQRHTAAAGARLGHNRLTG